MRLVLVLMATMAAGGCSSMLLGGSGPSAGNPIGTDTRTSAQVAADDRIATTIRSKFAVDADLSGAGLRVDARAGTVTLRGSVSGFSERDRAVRIANDVAGVVRVDNQISISSP